MALPGQVGRRGAVRRASLLPRRSLAWSRSVRASVTASRLSWDLRYSRFYPSDGRDTVLETGARRCVPVGEGEAGPRGASNLPPDLPGTAAEQGRRSAHGVRRDAGGHGPVVRRLVYG